MMLALQGHKAGVGQVLGEVAAEREGNVQVMTAVQHQGGDGDGR